MQKVNNRLPMLRFNNMGVPVNSFFSGGLACLLDTFFVYYD